MLGAQLTMFFSLRCLVIKYPIRMLSVLTLLTATALALMQKIIEGHAYEILNIESSSTSMNDYRNVSNCLWNMLVTMTTVGYGDYYPVTNLGRLIIIICALSGIVLVSLIIISLQSSLKMDANEQKVNLFI